MSTRTALQMFYEERNDLRNTNNVFCWRAVDVNITECVVEAFTGCLWTAMGAVKETFLFSPGQHRRVQPQWLNFHELIPNEDTVTIIISHIWSFVKPQNNNTRIAGKPGEKGTTRGNHPLETAAGRQRWMFVARQTGEKCAHVFPALLSNLTTLLNPD